MNVTINLSEQMVQKLENKCNEILPKIIEEVLEGYIDELLKDVVFKQLKSCALIYIQSADMRQKMMDKVKPVIDKMVCEK